MILKVVFAQPVYDHHKENNQSQYKSGLSKKKSTSFASVLENAMKYAGKK